MTINQTKTFQNRKTSRELNNVMLAELHHVNTTDTRLSLFIASWITTHLVCNNCKPTSVYGTTTNEIPFLKSGA